jgi:hypothetical protein
MRDMRSAYKILAKRLKGRDNLGDTRANSYYLNYLKEIGCEDTD